MYKLLAQDSGAVVQPLGKSAAVHATAIAYVWSNVLFAWTGTLHMCTPALFHLIAQPKQVQQVQSWPPVQVHAAEAAVPSIDVGDKDTPVHSNHHLQQTVLQQQADICRLESELAAMQHRFQHMGRSVTLCHYMPSCTLPAPYLRPSAPTCPTCPHPPILGSQKAWVEHDLS